MNAYLETFGYLGAYLVALIEGEVLYLSTIIAARMGYLDFYLVMFLVFLGAVTHDIGVYLIARKAGQKILKKRPNIIVRFERMQVLLAEHPLKWMLLYRFMYGVRSIFLMAFALSHIPLRKALINIILSVGLWVITYGVAGYFFAEIMIERIEDFAAYTWYIISGLVLTGMAIWGYRNRRKIRKWLSS